VLIARLPSRAIEFCRASIKAGIAVPWTRVVSGLLRMQLFTDVLFSLRERVLLIESDLRDLMPFANSSINSGEED
jgi:hypothetical protein